MASIHFRIIRSIVFICLLLGAPLAFADGMMYNEIGTSVQQSEYIGESSQRAFVYYDPASGQTRILFDVKTIAFEGGFAWIVPLPYIPQEPSLPAADIEEIPGTADGFDLLSRMTAPRLTVIEHFVRRDNRFFFGCGADPVPPGGETIDEDIDWSVQLWSESKSENLTFAQISAANAADIALWLKDRGYGDMPQEDLPVFQDYCDGGFSFLVVTGRENRQTSHHSCIAVTFPADGPFFPLRISSLGTEQYIDLTIYVCAPAPFRPADFVFPFQEEMWMHGYEFGDGEIPSAEFNEELERFLYHNGLSLSQPLPTDWYWQDCSLTLSIDTEHPFRDPDQFPFLSDLFIPESVWVGRFHRAFESVDDLQDMHFQATSQEDFRGEIIVHVNVMAKERETHRQKAAVDLSLLLLLLVFPCMLRKRNSSKTG